MDAGQRATRPRAAVDPLTGLARLFEDELRRASQQPRELHVGVERACDRSATMATRRTHMRREQLTEKILDLKREHGWTWKHITGEIGGMSPVLVVGALLGQMKLVKPLAHKAALLFGLSPSEERML